MPPPSCEDTQRQFRLDLDPDDSESEVFENDGSVIILDDDGYED